MHRRGKSSTHNPLNFIRNWSLLRSPLSYFANKFVILQHCQQEETNVSTSTQKHTHAREHTQHQQRKSCWSTIYVFFFLFQNKTKMFLRIILHFEYSINNVLYRMRCVCRGASLLWSISLLCSVPAVPWIKIKWKIANLNALVVVFNCVVFIRLAQ